MKSFAVSSRVSSSVTLVFRQLAGGVLLLLLALFVSPTAARGATGDEHWDTAFGWPGTTNYVYAIASHNGILYTAGQSNANNTNTVLWAWDGVAWSNVVTFYGSSGVIVYDLAFIGDTLYAVGTFTNVNGVNIRGLAQYNGTTWSDVGGFNAPAYNLAPVGNNLYVGGRYATNLGGIALTNIGYWDGAAWHALGSGLGRTGDTVDALSISNGVVYAGGLFTNSGPTAVTNIAMWNGASWAPVGTGLNGQVMSLARLGTDLYASGFFTKAGAVTANYVAKWDGTNWSALGSGLNGGLGVLSLTIFSNRLCVGGYFDTAGGSPATNFATWNGVAWSSGYTNISGGGSFAVNRVAAIGNTLYMGGLFTTLNRVFVNQFAAWDGSNWSPVGNPKNINGLFSLTTRALATDGSNIYAGGTFGYAGQLPVNRIARWDSTSWQALGGGLNNQINAIAVNGSDVYVAGTFTSAGGVPVNHLARWDGSTWHDVGGGISGTVNTVAMYGNDLLVGGNFQFAATDRTTTALARWDGANWWSFGGFLFTVTIGGLGVDTFLVNGSDVYVGGNFNAANITTFAGCSNVVRFDGVDWQPMGSGVNSNVFALAAMGTDIYVGGNFTNASGLAVSRIARWDGNNWSPMGAGVAGTGNFSVSALCAIGNKLYAAGSFTNASGINVNRIAQWDGASWSPLGGGVSYPGLSSASVSALTAAGNDLYAGGAFISAGGKSSAYFAHWNDSKNFDQPPSILLTKLRYAGGIFKLTVNATTNVPSYIIEGATNFSNWTPLDTNTATFYEFWDVNAGSFPKRFYRARVGP
jgi:hypothetical protein